MDLSSNEARSPSAPEAAGKTEGNETRGIWGPLYHFLFQRETWNGKPEAKRPHSIGSGTKGKTKHNFQAPTRFGGLWDEKGKPKSKFLGKVLENMSLRVVVQGAT